MSSAQILALIGGSMVGFSAYNLWTEGFRFGWTVLGAVGLVFGWLAVTA